MRADILIKNATILPMDDAMSTLYGSCIAIKDRKIIDVGKCEGTEAAKVIDCTGKVCVPGLVNSHTHAAMSLLRGVADDLPLDVWLTKNIFPLEAKYVDREFVRLGVELAAAEMIRSGTTMFLDMYYYAEEAAQVVEKAGIKGVFAEALVDFPTPNEKSVSGCLSYNERFIGKWNGSLNIYPCMVPHTIYTCSPDLLKEVKKISGKYDLPLHIHLSETKKEVEDCLSKTGMTPVNYLKSLGFLGPKTSFAHYVHPRKGEYEVLREFGISVVHCPESNMKLASGIAPVSEMIKEGINVCIGTDGPASNNNLDILEEISTCAKMQKVLTGDPTAVDARTALRMATINGAKAFGLDAITGSIEKDKLADICIIDLNKPHLTPVYDHFSHLVYCAGGSDVDTVISNGIVIMENGKLLTIDEEEIMDKARYFSERIKDGK